MKVGDAQYAFLEVSFSVIFAIGVNFQNYAETAGQLMNQILGALSALRFDPNAYIAFEIGNNEDCAFDIMNRSYKERTFALLQFLDDNNIRYTTKDFIEQSGVKLSLGHVIRIYRQTETGEDSVPKLDAALKTDISKYEESIPWERTLKQESQSDAKDSQ